MVKARWEGKERKKKRGYLGFFLKGGKRSQIEMSQLKMSLTKVLIKNFSARRCIKPEIDCTNSDSPWVEFADRNEV